MEKDMSAEMSTHCQTKYLTIHEWCKTHSWPPEGGLRHLIFHAATNGFNKVIRRCGRRILINEQEFIRWIEANHNGQLAEKKDARKMA